MSVEIETDTVDLMPTAEMLRRAEQFAPHYPGITSMLTAGCTQPFRVSDRGEPAVFLGHGGIRVHARSRWTIPNGCRPG